MKHKAGYIALIGPTNSGKSTLFNRLIEAELSPVTKKPETTWMPIRGIISKSDYQIIFSDCAGLPSKTNKMTQFLIDSIKSEISRADLILITALPNSQIGIDELINFAALKKKPSILLVNSNDGFYDGKYNEYNLRTLVFSFAIGSLDKLNNIILDFIPESNAVYDKDQLSLETERTLIANIIRAKAMELLSKELPHQIAVMIDEMKIRENGIQYIHSAIWVDRESQRPIIIGKNGKMIKQIGISSRKAIEELLLDRTVFLDLIVKVKKGWTKKISMIKAALRPD